MRRVHPRQRPSAVRLAPHKKPFLAVNLTPGTSGEAKAVKISHACSEGGGLWG